MKKIYLFLSLLLAVSFYACNDDLHDVEAVEQTTNRSSINRTAKVDAVRYTFRDVTVNPELILLNDENSTLIANEEPKYSFEIYSSEITDKISIGNTLYMNSNGLVLLKSITGLTKEGNVYHLETTDAQLGDLFSGGSLELSVDVDEAKEIMRKKSSLRGTDFDNGFAFDLFDMDKEFTLSGLTINPKSQIRTILNLKLGFGDSKVLPNEMVASLEFQSKINPYLSFHKTIDSDFTIDFIDPLKTFVVDVDIPLAPLIVVPLNISLENLEFPTYVAANITKNAYLSFYAGGSFKIGYAYYNNVPNKSSHYIYENSMTSTGVAEFDFVGDVYTDTKLKITPRISLVSSKIFKVSSSIMFGIETNNNGYINTVSKEYTAKSKGVFSTSGSMNISALNMTVLELEFFDVRKDMWESDNFDDKIEFSNLKIAKPSKKTCNDHSYSYDMTLDYKYPIEGKKISGDLEITYDVYDNTNKLMLKSNEVVTVSPRNITDKSFSFSLCVPLRVDPLAILSGFVKKTGYIKNIRIRDRHGNSGSGIDNPMNNELSNEILIASPYNSSFWK